MAADGAQEEEEEEGDYLGLCPKCKQATLELTHIGVWDGMDALDNFVSGYVESSRCSCCRKRWERKQTYEEREAGGPVDLGAIEASLAKYILQKKGSSPQGRAVGREELRFARQLRRAA